MTETEGRALSIYQPQALERRPGFFSRVRAFLNRDIGDAAQSLMSTLIPINWQQNGEPELTNWSLEQMAYAYEREVYFYSCVSARAADIAAIPPIIEVDGEPIERPWPDVLQLFDAANPHESWSDLVFAAMVDDAIFGEAFALWEGNTAWWMPSVHTTAMPDSHELVSGYTVAVNNHTKTYQPEEVISLRRHGPRNVVNGLGLTTPLAQTLQTLSWDRAYELALPKNNGCPSGILSVPGHVSPQARKENLKEWRLAHTGKNARSIALLSDGARFEKIGLDPADSQLSESLARCYQNVRMATGVPSVRLAGAEDDYNATSREQLANYELKTVIPNALRWYAAVNRVVFALTPNIRVRPDIESLPNLAEMRRANYATAVAAAGRPIASINEARTKILGWTASDEPKADELILAPVNPLQLFAGGQQSGAAAQSEEVATPGLDVQKTALNGAQVTALKEIVQAVAAGQLPRESGVAIIIAAFPITPEQAEEIMGEVGRGFTPEPPPSQQPAPASDARTAPVADAEARALRVEQVRSKSRISRVARNYAAMERERDTCKRAVAVPLLKAMLAHDLEALRKWESQRTDAFRSSGILPQLAVVRCAPLPSNPDTRKRPLWLKDGRAMPPPESAIEFRAGAGKVDLPDWRDFVPALTKSHGAWFKAAAVRVASDELAALQQQHRSMRSAQGRSAVVRDLGASYSVDDARILEALSNRAQKIVTVPETVQGLAREAIAQALEQGATQTEMNKALTTLFDDLEDWEAMRIGTTEASACSSQASWWAMGDAGTSKKGWLQSSFGPGKRVEHSQNMDQGAIPFDQPFASGQQFPHDPDMDDPELDINCTCVVTAEEFSPVGGEE
jgi:HK97 family phage portal protein